MTDGVLPSMADGHLFQSPQQRRAVTDREVIHDLYVALHEALAAVKKFDGRSNWEESKGDN